MVVYIPCQFLQQCYKIGIINPFLDEKIEAVTCLRLFNKTDLILEGSNSF